MPLCQMCGCCCQTFSVFASSQDALREPRIAIEAITIEPWLQTAERAYRLFPLPFHEGCAFLDPTGRCAIHPTRPGVCRKFEPGCRQCDEAREAHGLAPIASTSGGLLPNRLPPQQSQDSWQFADDGGGSEDGRR